MGLLAAQWQSAAGVYRLLCHVYVVVQQQILVAWIEAQAYLDIKSVADMMAYVIEALGTRRGTFSGRQFESPSLP